MRMCGPANAICDPKMSMKGHLYMPIPEGRTAMSTGSSCTSCIPTKTPTVPPAAYVGSGVLRSIRPVPFSSLFTSLTTCYRVDSLAVNVPVLSGD